MQFIDEAIIQVIGGKGGSGSVSFRREKFIPKGGPNGGNGGKGGNIYAIADKSINTLVNFRYKRLYHAENGKNGRGSDKYGASATNIYLRVPLGTIVYDNTTNQIICDLNRDQEKVLLALGGKGGLGNVHFKSSVNRIPRQFTYGEDGENRYVRFELKILADVGLLGKPNAGKSTLISKLSHAKPKIAQYPFTTLYPYLGAIQSNSSLDSIIIADLPGLVEGASVGIGLGHLFLRHLKRTSLLLHLVEVPYLMNTNDAVNQAVLDVKTITQELVHYDSKLLLKPRWLLLTKIDLLSNPEDFKNRLCQQLHWKAPVFLISSLNGVGLNILVRSLKKYLNR